MSAPSTEIEQLVRSYFTVNEYFVLPEGELEFQIAYAPDTKQKFVRLDGELEAKGFRPELTGTKDECVLLVRKASPQAGGRSAVSVLMALLTVGSLGVFAWLQTSVDEQLVPGFPEYLLFAGFGVTVGVLLGAHELGQRLAARRGKAGRSTGYVIPGVPLLTPFLPSLGFVNAQKEPALNRDKLFDVVIAGPLAIFVLAVVLYIVGALSSVSSTMPFQNTQLVNTTVSINPNAIQTGLDYLLGPLVQGAPAGYVQVSPIADGASFGFILVFICLLPMAIFDGGLLASASWGDRAARAATYVSVLLLLVLDMTYATYWAVAIVVLLLAGRSVKLKLLDEVSALSTKRQWVFLGALILAFLCLPVPHSIATFPLP
ncbi:MAG TPA: site-2 protease family protein [Nitrososphaerales archaeon]|nr:site-2 protease family protein [Nitrososphaerales archaeon]